jgi:rare lipoprotein A (peptidoglycan hydrolase)
VTAAAGPDIAAIEPFGIERSPIDSTAPKDTSPSKPAKRTGTASTYGPGWDGWIAWPDGPGWRLRVCGPGGCVVVVTTDAGPDRAMQRAGRIVDLDVATFERVAGVSWTTGLTKVTVTVLGEVSEAHGNDPQS